MYNVHIVYLIYCTFIGSSITMFTMPSPLAAKWKPSDRRILRRRLTWTDFTCIYVPQQTLPQWNTEGSSFPSALNRYANVSWIQRVGLQCPWNERELTQRAWTRCEPQPAWPQSVPGCFARPTPSAGAGSNGTARRVWRTLSGWLPCWEGWRCLRVEGNSPCGK